MSDWLNNVHKSTTELRNISSQLLELSRSFRDTGNNYMFSVLNDISHDIYDLQETIDKSVGISITEQYKTAEQHSANLLELVLNTKVSDEKI